MARQNYENGYYIGAVNADGKRHGYGTYYWNSGSRYEGDWYLGDMHGHGTYYYKDGDKYEGEFYHDDRHGFGVFSYTSGARYEGEYRNDKRTGKGTYFYADGDKYVGDFVDGDFHGKGTYYWNSGAWYEGDWANDERNGMGTYHYPDGTWTYGEYKDSKLVRTVRSSQTLNNGGCQQRRKVCIEDIRDGLDGDDNGDVREQTADNGNGGNNVRTVKYSNGTYVGALDDSDEPSGYGEFTFDSGAKYAGYFLHGKRNGKGVYTYAGGDSYEGFFKDGDFQGYGVYRWKNGNRYEGEYRNDKAHGYGVIHNNDGSWMFVHYNDGEIDETLLDSADIASAVGASDAGELNFNSGTYRGSIERIVKKSGLFGLKKEEEIVAQGLGEFSGDDGHKYEGYYVKDERYGYGRFTSAKGIKIYGNFAVDHYDGVVCVVSDRGVYVGKLGKDGLFDGEASFYYTDCWYEGGFKNGDRDGRGTMHMQNGETVVGDFVKNEMKRTISRS